VTFPYECARAATVKHAVEALGVPHTEVGPVIVNAQAATLPRLVHEGDRIEVHPRAGGEPLDHARFIADAHLGGLARFLRMLGIDTLFENTYADPRIIELAAHEQRIVVTRDRELLKCREVLRGCFVHALKPEAQLKEVAARYALIPAMRPFTLCLHCNFELETIATGEVAKLVPDRIAAHYPDFKRCPGCRRVYWEGSHWQHMRTLLARSLEMEIPETTR
ncbi:MAG TPA: Mut7-C RNAse domain-containing protein, partial [Burkholderiales bacterium]|nr:Mut7-C RNAse domain-containing protein [Burkholderiales bacterium]